MERFGVQVPALERCARRRAGQPADTEPADRVQVWAADRPQAANKGAKCYWVGSPRQALAHCRRLVPAERNLYEVVQPDTPCHLYVDAEFRRSQEPQIRDERALDRRLLHELFSLAQRLFFPDERADDHRRYAVSVLRSQSPQDAGLDWDDPRRGDKRSKHWVVHIRGCAFASNFHCGAFMRRLAAHLYQTHGRTTDPARNPFFLHGAADRPPHEFCVDMGVYTRNRVFRTAYSSKVSDYRPLLPEPSPLDPEDARDEAVSTNAGKRPRPGADDRDLHETVFFDTCVQHVPPRGVRLLHVTEPHTDAEPTGTSHRSAFLEPPSVTYGGALQRAASAASALSVAPRGAGTGAEWFQAAAPPKCVRALLLVLLRDYWGALHAGLAAPPPPPRHAALAVLRWHPARHSLVVSSRLHECAMAGRAHSGNHVYFVVDALRLRYSQRCHNTSQCGGRRSAARLLDAPGLGRQLARESIGTLLRELQSG